MNDPTLRCDHCAKPKGFCVCDKAVPARIKTRVLVIQHPREQDRDLGTVPLLRAVLGKNCEVSTGLSWGSFGQCVGDENADPKRWGVLFPHSLKKPLAPEDLRTPVVMVDRQGDVMTGQRLVGIVALDGTWSQAKTLWWRNPWMLKLNRVLLHPKEPSIYGKLRKEPRNDALSTLESVADALVANGEPEALRADLRKLFRTMVQRARDYQKTHGATFYTPSDEPDSNEM
jgi:DTW domain-containing protein